MCLSKSIGLPTKKSCVKKSLKCCMVVTKRLPLQCRYDKTFLEKCPHQSRSGYSSNFYEMPSKALHAMAGLDRKVLNSRRITKRAAPSNPVFSRSFITSFGVASYRSGVEHVPAVARVPLLFYHSSRKKDGAFGHLREIVYICTAKPKQYKERDNEGLFI